MRSYNIMILSVGRRVELVNCFRRAARRLGVTSAIVGCDCQSTAPALYFSDRVSILPRISSPHYIDSVIQACVENDVALVVPTIDTGLLLLSENRSKIQNRTQATVLISDSQVIRICRDKVSTQVFLEANGFLVPRLYSDAELKDPSKLRFPLFVKPRNGSSSIDACRVGDPEELRVRMRTVENAIVQDLVQGDEFSVDCFLDLGGNVITVVPRLRIATRGGEVSKGRVVKDKAIIAEVRRLLTLLRPIGPVTVQCVRTDRGIEFLEINPRFGGGAPMSICAGADSCENLYRLMMGEKLEYSEDYVDGLLFLRFDASICLDRNDQPVNHGVGEQLRVGLPVDIEAGHEPL